MATENKTQIDDLSRHVVQLARTVDRLAPGTYEITITKPDLRQQDWQFEIIRTEKITSGSLSSTTYLGE